MTEEQKTKPPAKEQDTGKGSGEGQKSAKTVEELQTDLATLKAEKETLEKRLSDKDDMINKQGNEVGELRKQIGEHAEVLNRFRGDDSKKTENSILTEIAEKMQKNDPTLSKENALYNAQIVTEGYNTLRQKERIQEITNDALDRLEDAFESKHDSLDRKIWGENKDDIMTEYNRLKVSKSGREMAKNLRWAYEQVVKRKADVMRKEKGELSEEERQKAIDEQTVGVTQKTKKQREDEDTKARNDIKNAGGAGLEGSAFA